MALIQYNLVEDKNGNYSVTASLLEVDEGDRIQFKSSIPGAAVKYRENPSLEGSNAPKANVPLEVGNNGKKGPFTVTKRLTKSNRVTFKCGVLTKGGSLNPATPKFVPFPGRGQGTPPGRNSNGDTGL